MTWGVSKGAGAGPQGEGTAHVTKASNPRVPKIMLEGRGLCRESERAIAVAARAVLYFGARIVISVTISNTRTDPPVTAVL